MKQQMLHEQIRLFTLIRSGSAGTREKWSLGFQTRSDTNQPVQSQKKARILKFWIEVEEELYYPTCSNKNKGPDQLCSYCTADLRFCFRIDQNPVFSVQICFVLLKTLKIQ